NPHMAILCPMRVTKTLQVEYHAHYMYFFELSTPFCLAANGMYISEIGESMLEPGQRISVELLRGEEYAETEGANEGGEN
ncbi:MAG: molybdopterin molybdenumtransferase MoeA, partial [Clostridium sp.]|nr:molybdopterin molybdenumtransferase MoeA [Clostridium sp.]